MNLPPLGLTGSDISPHLITALAVLLLRVPAAPAAGYDRDDCRRSLPQRAVLHDVDTVRINAGNYCQVRLELLAPWSMLAAL